MLRLVCLFVMLCVAHCAVYPANFGPESCVNYPFCGPTPGVAHVPGALDTLAARQAVVDAEVRLLAMSNPKVPGLEAHAAAEAKVRRAQIAYGLV